MARQSTFELYDRILAGGLRDLLAGWKAEGLSMEEIAFRLRGHAVTVSRDTVRRWYERMEEEVA